MAEVEQGTKIEGEGSEQHSNPEVAQQKLEERAKKDGWAPEENWRGNPEDWVPAKEFLGRQKLFDRIDSLKKALQSQKHDFEKDMRVISKSVAEMNEQAYKRALGELKAQRGLAIEDKNLEAVEALDAEIDDTKIRMAEAAAQKRQTPVTQESPDFIEWRDGNKWFVDNNEMREDAIAIGIGYAAKNQNLTEKQVYDYVSRKIEKLYPEAFGKGKVKEEEDDNETNTTERSRKVSTVETGGGRTTTVVTKKTKGVSVDDLNDQEKQVMKTLIKRGALKELATKNKRTEQEEYLAQYNENASRTR